MNWIVFALKRSLIISFFFVFYLGIYSAQLSLFGSKISLTLEKLIKVIGFFAMCGFKGINENEMLVNCMSIIAAGRTCEGYIIIKIQKLKHYRT